jgi:hypothetical protein
MSNANRNNWSQSGSTFCVRSVSNNTENLPAAIYTIHKNPMNGELYLETQAERFGFPFKVYGLETDFINRVARTFEHTKSNLGILLNGVKGTGKTVTCEQIANRMIDMGLPVVLVANDDPNLVAFMNEFQQDTCFLFDEYEKNFGRESYGAPTKLLSIMDGVLNSAFRKVFLLTTNNLHVDDNLLQRPGRIRYLKTYGNLSVQQIIEIVDDKLVHKELRQDVIRSISQLQIITADIVSSIVNEVNIHNESPESFLPFFNVSRVEAKFDVYETIQDSNTGAMVEKISVKGALVRPSVIDPETCIGSDLYANRMDLGEIQEVKDNGVVVTSYYDNLTEKRTTRTFRVSKNDYGYNRAFYGYAY